MKRETVVVLLLLVGTTFSGAFAATAWQERKPKKVKRVKRPTYSQKDWDGIYFEDLFEQGLVGDRPAKAKPGAPGQTNPVVDASDASDSTGEFAWSKFVSRTTLEDEVKSLQTQLAVDVTTPVKFKSDYGKVHQSFSILSMLFAIVREYDSDVRWKEDGGAAQVSFERAAANSRVGTIQAYESCKRRKEDLEEMVRGGSFNGDDKPAESLDWSIVIDRTPIMKRLQVSKDGLKRLSANENEFNGGIEDVLHESELIAAMAQTLMKENMLDADDGGYLALAKAMSDAAVATQDACKSNDYSAAANAINLIDQSCNNCHDEWK